MSRLDKTVRVRVNSETERGLREGYGTTYPDRLRRLLQAASVAPAEAMAFAEKILGSSATPTDPARAGREWFSNRSAVLQLGRGRGSWAFTLFIHGLDPANGLKVDPDLTMGSALVLAREAWDCTVKGLAASLAAQEARENAYRAALRGLHQHAADLLELADSALCEARVRHEEAERRLRCLCHMDFEVSMYNCLAAEAARHAIKAEAEGLAALTGGAGAEEQRWEAWCETTLEQADPPDGFLDWAKAAKEKLVQVRATLRARIGPSGSRPDTDWLALRAWAPDLVAALIPLDADVFNVDDLRFDPRSSSRR